jgi:polygalacturonase
MKRLLVVSCVVALAATASALVPASVSVKDFGAKGDGQALDTGAINNAIDAASQAGGGTVFFPPGTYLSTSIRLKSHTTLYLEHGATIEAAAVERATYDPPEPNEWEKYQDFSHGHWHNSLIWGENVEDVAIVGPGTIHGTGLTRTDAVPQGGGDKAIGLKNSHNVTIRDVTIWHGGHLAILATGVDNMTVDNIRMDTNRDGIDVDACKNVRIANSTFNTPFDDGICLKSSYGLGVARATENVTVTNCLVSGYDEGTMLDDTYKRTVKYARGATGRVKFGTESNGGFKNITISNVVFDYSRGLAIESVDGGNIEDVSITNITMRDIVNAPIFVRLGNRARGPNNPPPGVIRRVNISNIVASSVDPRHGILISGIPGHPIEDLRLNNVRIAYKGGGTGADRELVPQEKENAYPEPDMFGNMPSYGLYARHVSGLSLSDVELSTDAPDARPAFMLNDVSVADFNHVKTQRPSSPAGAPTFVLQNVKDFVLRNSPWLKDATHQRVDRVAF